MDDPAVQVTGAAENLVKAQLKSPSTAEFQDEKVLERSSDYFLVYISVDAENSFGTKLRSQFLVVCQMSDGTHYQYDKQNAVQSCQNPPTDDEIAMTKTLNNWPKQ
jgi:hypothetical protein